MTAVAGIGAPARASPGGGWAGWRWLAIWSAIGVTVVWHCWSASFNHDEIEHLHAAWLISIGQLPYRDFLEQHHPTLWFLAAPLVAKFESVHRLVFAARLFNAVNLVAVLWLVGCILRRLYPEVSWQFPVLLLVASFMFVRNSIEFRPDPVMNVALYGGLLNWLAFLEQGRLKRALAAGILFGAAVAILQKAAVIVGLNAIGVPFLMARRFKRSDDFARLALGSVASIAASSLLVALLWGAMQSLGIFGDFWFWNYPFNRFFYMQANLPQHFSLSRSIGLSFLLDPLLWLAGAFGAWSCLRTLLRRVNSSSQDECRFTLLVLAFGYLAFLCLNRFPLDQYLIVLLPLLAIFAAESWRVAPRCAGRLMERFTLAAPVVLVAVLLLYPSNHEQLRVQEFVLGRTTPNQAVFVPPAFNPILRRDAAYFWYNGDLISGVYEQYCKRVEDCPRNKLALDENRWAALPPAFVLLGAPARYPYHWTSRGSSYRPSQLPRLWEHQSGEWAFTPANIANAPPREGGAAKATGTSTASSGPIAAGARSPP